VDPLPALPSDLVANLLPDPEPRPRKYTIVSVDDHLIEPPDLFEGRMPTALADRAPRVVRTDEGAEMWLYEDTHYPNVGLNAVVGRPQDEWSMEPARFDEMRRGCWDIHARIRDMDIGGIEASLNFPSLLAGFAGTVFSRSKDPDLGLACVRAWNDWHHNVWAGTYPERIIPLQIPWLCDPVVAADEIRVNAERGFRAVSFAENPANIGLPSVHTDHWDPFLRACEETETVVCLHTGSSAWTAASSPGAPLELLTTLFPANALAAAADWVWARIPLRFPGIKVAMAEGGIGWVPMLLDRLDYVVHHSAQQGGVWDGSLLPSEALQRNFWFCTIDDPSTMELRGRIGIDHIMLESDYPHADSTWPDTQLVAERRIGALPETEVRKLTYENASRLFRHPVATKAA
jgi:predicted TIM-barrel fold metal-dependent hydrolase